MVFLPLALSVANAVVKSAVILFLVGQNVDALAMKDSGFVVTVVRFTGVIILVLSDALVDSFDKRAFVFFSASCQLSTSVVVTAQELTGVDGAIEICFCSLAVGFFLEEGACVDAACFLIFVEDLALVRSLEFPVANVDILFGLLLTLNNILANFRINLFIK